MIDGKLKRLATLLQSYGTLAIAFSGGVDSTFLLAFSKEILGAHVFAVTAQAPNFSQSEMQEASLFCRQQEIRQFQLPLGVDFLSKFSHNPPNRCYLCKKNLFSDLIALAKQNGADTIADGTNADDVKDYRPGLSALHELNVQSPMKEVGLTKAEIRQALKDRSLPVWDKPAFACLASRIPYHEEITVEKLASIAALEEELHRLGFLQCRVRHHGSIARIEILPEARIKFMDSLLMDQVNTFALQHGFTYAALDLGGYRMGSMNTDLATKGNDTIPTD